MSAGGGDRNTGSGSTDSDGHNTGNGGGDRNTGSGSTDSDGHNTGNGGGDRNTASGCTDSDGRNTGNGGEGRNTGNGGKGDRPALGHATPGPTTPDRRGLRTGWTTGTCASAAAKAAALALVTGTLPDEVEVALPAGRRVTFPVHQGALPNQAVVIKDAGDDPDCTDGAHLTATVRAAPGHAGTDLLAGPGVGTVTRPGLGLPTGAPAINPVPRRMITGALAEVTLDALSVTFSVPGGEAMAAKTTNDRLGIVGGISILGTTGIVRPFSTAAYRASVVQQVDVAAAGGQRAMVLATGSRSEQAAMRLLADLDPVCFVEVGDFTGIALRRAAAAGMVRATVVAMVGKITKLAAGVMMTHFHRSKVDNAVLHEAATASGAPLPVLEAATETATARHFFEICLLHQTPLPLQRLCRRASEACRAHVGGALEVEVWMVDFDGVAVVASG